MQFKSTFVSCVLGILGAGSMAHAGSYLTTGEVLIDPILTIDGGVHAYTGAIASGHYMGDANLKEASLQDVDLSGLNAKRANLSGSDLTRGLFNSTYLISGKMIGSVLVDADFTNANLMKVSFGSANFQGANLTNANLHQANFDGANLSGANLTDTGLVWARGDGTIFDSFTILKNGKTIGEHGFDAAGLEQYFSDQDATFSNVTMAVVPVPGAAPLGIAGLICVAELRRRALRRATKARR